MREREVRRRTIRQHDLIDECIKIDRVFIEAADVALARIAQRALRQSLPAPVERRDCEPARAQIAHGLEVFLDELGAALKQADGALASRRRRAARKAQLDTIGRSDCPSQRILRQRIGGYGNEVHMRIGIGESRSGRPVSSPYSSPADALNASVARRHQSSLQDSNNLYKPTLYSPLKAPKERPYGDRAGPLRAAHQTGSGQW